MNSVIYRSWPAASAIHQQLNQIFDRSGSDAGQWSPRVDIRENAERFLIQADLPGVDLQAIEIQMERNVLSLRGERAAPTLEEGDKASRSERRYGPFERRFVLPETADADGIVAEGRNGVLEITIPKKAQAGARRIQVAAKAEPSAQ
ncbi:Hsp20/alpha crystallin family protein [Pseudoxanthomonas composti]|uniref:Hsp20/alpha crystallin family protein n=1 Tax=Pseudoxanthomonas composti TaxID=2137479 RepID=A0A4Q1JZW0_9GAMM|nr:Hsp20/alpha crystallin family protein [Pseudoxanthomonas composti]RXR07247.1 Hsp20/alpha crystallin family protein [Pseudoxanthomonas composti]